MTTGSNNTGQMLTELREALSDSGFTQVRVHSRWTYARAFVRNEADRREQALSRPDVEADLKEHTTLQPVKSTTHKALTQLVEAGILECETSREPHVYWLSLTLESTPHETLDNATTSPQESSPSESAPSQPSETNTHSQSRLHHIADERISLSTLVIGLTLTLLTLVLLRLSVPITISIGSAALAWATLSIGNVELAASAYHRYR
jgi:hypothetical protein